MMSGPKHAQIRRALHDEAESLGHLAFRSKAYWGYSEDFMEACRAELTLSASYLREHSAFIIECDQTVAGFYTLERLSHTEVELGYLFVEPSMIGKGYGRKLIDHAKEHARSLGYESMIIQSDPNAVRFYRATGGSVIGTKESMSIPGRVIPLLRIAL